jgi:3-oxoadipate enol-lactonase
MQKWCLGMVVSDDEHRRSASRPDGGHRARPNSGASRGIWLADRLLAEPADDRLGLDKADFVGNSWGGMIGATFAATYPERIGGAVLMNCTAGRASLRQKLEFAILLRVAKWTGGIGSLLNRSVLKAFLGPTTMRERPDVVAHVSSTVKSVNIASASWAVKSVVPRRPDQRALLGRIHTPVMVVGGAEDATFPPRDAIDMAKAIPNASIRVLDGVAHLAGLENPPLVSALVEQFLFSGSESGSAAT